MAAAASSSISSSSSSSPLAEAFLVSPYLPTPHNVLRLTHGSAMAGLSSLVRSHALIFEFHPAPSFSSSSADPLDVITCSPFQVLVPYYPLAGRIVQTSHGWEVRCDGRGAVVVVTSLPSIPPPTPEPYPIAPALLVQITELADGGGFKLGIRVCNGICDASGLIHFLSGWAEMARGEGRVSVAPVWNAFAAHVPHYNAGDGGVGLEFRPPDEFPSVYRRPHESSSVYLPSPPEKSQGNSSVYYVPILQQHGGDDNAKNLQKIHFPSLGVPEAVHQAAGDQRTSFTGEAVRLELPLRSLKATVWWLHEKEGSVCGMSHVLAAHVWRERTRALRIPPSADTRLFFVCDTVMDMEKKQIAAASAPMGFYGPFKFNCVATARAGDLLEMPLSWAANRVKLVHDNLTHDSFRACFDEFKRLHSAARPMAEVLIFTEMPLPEAVQRQLDFGPSLGGPDRLHEGLLGFPSSVNVAAVAPPLDSSKVAPSYLQIYFNNVSDADVDELRRGICDSLSVFDQLAASNNSSRL